MSKLKQYLGFIFIAAIFVAVIISMGILFFSIILGIGTGGNVNFFYELQPIPMLFIYGALTIIISLMLFAKEND